MKTRPVALKPAVKRGASARMSRCFMAVFSIAMLSLIPCYGGDEAVAEDVKKEVAEAERQMAEIGKITEISLERKGSFGPSPVYSVVFHGSGLVEYVGENNVKLVGKHTGKVAHEKFWNLAAYIN